MSTISSKTTLIKQALKRLGIDKFVLSIHDQSFPSYPDEDIGRGTPYSRGGREFLKFIQQFGFTTVQFGPQGKTSKDNISPYDSAVFSRNILSLSPSLLCESFPELLTYDEFESIRAQYNGQLIVGDNFVDSNNSYDISKKIISTIYKKYLKNKDKNSSLTSKFKSYVQNQNQTDCNWFERDSIYEALTNYYTTDDWTLWNGPNRTFIDSRLYRDHEKDKTHDKTKRIEEIKEKYFSVIEQFALGQFLLEEQHDLVRDEAHSIGLRFYGDLQIGFSHQDIWAWNDLFLSEYLLGAPPSRSNIEGQPWGYPVLNPELYFTPDRKIGPALKLVLERVKKLLKEFDGLRIDHPHGLVCPWVYRIDVENPYTAVQNGARLFSSPNVEDHPMLNKFSIVREDQLNPDPNYPRYGEQWEQNLTEEQINQYATVIDLILNEAYAHNLQKEDILCEVLSTWPNPLKDVMTSRKLGRFCVTQKTDPNDPNDIYRRENTGPQDWIMAGNHDTLPLLLYIKEKSSTPWYAARSKLLASELSSEKERESFIQSLRDPYKFRDAMLTELFLGPARNVSMFFPDLFGMEQVYNKPGIIDDLNWKLRLTPDYKKIYTEKIKTGEAPDLARILSTALSVRFSGNEEVKSLADKLIS